MIFLAIGLVILIYSQKRLHDAFLWYLTYKIFLVTNINILSIPGIPVLTLDMALSFWFFFRIYRNRQHYCSVEMPYIRPIMFLMGAYFISTLFAIVGFKTAVSAYIKDICNILLTTWMMWKVVNTDHDFATLLKRLSFALLITCVYGIVEKIIQSNPLVEYETSLVNDASKVIDFNYGIDEYRGYRVQSVFEHAIGAGINWGMFVVLAAYSLIKMKNEIICCYKKLILLVSLFCIICLFFSNCRGPILFLLIAMIGVIDLKNHKFYCFLVIVTVAVVVGVNFLDETYINNFFSIFDSSYQSKVGGSSNEQRLDQFEASLALASQSQIWGLGYKFQMETNFRLLSRLLGLESIWIRTIVQFGIFGVIANLLLAYYMIIKIPFKYKLYYMIFFNAAYWITASLTSTPGMLMYLYYLINFFFIKQSDVYKNWSYNGK